MDVWSDKWDQFQASSRAFDRMKRIVLDVTPFVDDTEALEQYARDKQLTINEIIYYFNAFEYGGDDGLQAIRNPDIIPEDLARQAIRQIEKTLAHAGAASYRLTDEGTAIGVYQIMTRSNGDRYLEPVCQLRVTLATRHWHLYWLRKFDAWWPYPPPDEGPDRPGLGDRLQQVLDDVDGCFWV